MKSQGFEESWESCWELLGKLGVPLTSPPLQGHTNLIVSEAWDGETSLKVHAIEVNCINAMRCTQVIVIEL